MNHLVENGVPVERVAWTAGGNDDPPLGAFLVYAPSQQTRDFLAQTAAAYAVAIGEVQVVADNIRTQSLYHEGYPSGSVTGPLKVAVYYDGPTAFALRKLGFDAEAISANADLGAYDALVCDDYAGLDLAALTDWIADGGVYIANGPYGIIDGLLDVQPMGGYDSSFYWANNCLGSTGYSDSSLVTAGMGVAGYTFAFPITWFDLPGEGVTVDASYNDPYFLAGFWQIGDPTTLTIPDAAGKAVVVHGMYGSGRVTFIGPMAAFRAHTEGTYRLLANAIYTGNWSDDR